MKRKHNEGFSLVEVVVGIVILGIFVVPTCTSLILSLQMNQKAEQLLQAQLAVSSAVEELKAEGITSPSDTVSVPDVKLELSKTSGDLYYTVTVTSTKIDTVKATTIIRDITAIRTGGGS